VYHMLEYGGPEAEIDRQLAHVYPTPVVGSHKPYEDGTLGPPKPIYWTGENTAASNSEVFLNPTYGTAP